MNGRKKVFCTALAILILCFLLISLLLPALFNSINEQINSNQKVRLLSTEIYNIQKYRAKAAYFPEGAPSKEIRELSKIETKYKQARAESITNTLITTLQAFFLWLITVIATRLFNDYFYPSAHAFIQRKWQQCIKSER